MAIKADYILQCIDKIPGMSPTAMKIVEVCNSLTSSANEVNRVISVDPVITAKVLQLANSAYFSMPERVTSLVKAIVILGLNTIKNMAVSTAVLQNLSTNKESDNFDTKGFWEHSLGCAIGAKLIAKKIGQSKDKLEEFFIGGLLHDIGKIVLSQVISEEYDKVILSAQKSGRPIVFEEAFGIGITHSEIGGKLAEKWKFSKILKTTIMYHHKINKCDEEYQTIVAAVILADHLCNKDNIGFSCNFKVPSLKPSILDILGLSEADFGDITEKIEKNIEKATDFLQVLSK